MALQQPVEKLTLIGVGLIGGSLLRGLRQAGVVSEITVSDRNERVCRRAVALGIADQAELDPAVAVQDADVVVLAVPVGAMAGVLGSIVGTIAGHCVVTDVGSTKKTVVDACRHVCGEMPSWFVPGHPIAGTEKSGVEASFATLFEQRRVILTPLLETCRDALETVRSLWQAVGAEVVEMGVEHHDQVLAATSHLPHVLAYALVDTLARMDDRAEIFRYAAGGFRDFTRIASSNPDLWVDICLANRNPLQAMIRRYRDDLKVLEMALQADDAETIRKVFYRAKQARDNLYRE